MTATARMTKAELLKLLGKKDREISRLQRAAKRTRQAEADLASQEDVYRTLVDNLPQKIFLKDTSSRWLSANAGMLADVGMSAEEIRGKRDRDLFPPELADKYTADDQRIVASGETEELEEPYEVDGETIWVQEQ